MNKKSLLPILIATAMTGCASDYVNNQELNQVESVAIVVFNVPEYITRNTEDPEKISKEMNSSFSSSDLLAMAGNQIGGIVKDATDLATQSHIMKRIDGTEAANISITKFANQLGKLEGWTILPPSEVIANSTYKQVSADILSDPQIKTSVSFARATKSPQHYIQLPLPSSYNTQPDYYKQPSFTQGMATISRALNVDAVIVINDTGFSTDQESIFVGGNCFTKSALQYAMFNNNGEVIVDTRASFEKGNIVEQKGCVSGSFHDVDYIKALKAHGSKQAEVVHDKLNKIRS
ncbi:hypothetical protein [Vibrio nomapromontoriensis]|uniref:hypothetical protein n=1 Tax=Vibrio nomapromontoriensis TaxID=2910246 RepID=UPI003D124111